MLSLPIPPSPVTPGYLQTPPNEKSTGNQPVPAAPPPTSLEDGHLSDTHDPGDANSSSTIARPSIPSSTTSVSISNQSNVHIILPASAFRTQTPLLAQPPHILLSRPHHALHLDRPFRQPHHQHCRILPPPLRLRLRARAHHRHQEQRHRTNLPPI